MPSVDEVFFASQGDPRQKREQQSQARPTRAEIKETRPPQSSQPSTTPSSPLDRGGD